MIKNTTLVKGFTLIEILVVVGIMGLILRISFTGLKTLSNRQSVEKDTEIIYSVLQKARNRTLVGEGGSQYGVKFASTSITLFKGTGFKANDAGNEVTSLSNLTQINLVSLTGATTTVYFSKINGTPSATGTIELLLKTNSTLKEVITIHATGLSEVQ